MSICLKNRNGVIANWDNMELGIGEIMHGHEPNREGRRMAEKELLQRSASSVTLSGTRKIELIAWNACRNRSVEILFKTKRKVNWHKTVEEAVSVRRTFQLPTSLVFFGFAFGLKLRRMVRMGCCHCTIRRYWHGRLPFPSLHVDSSCAD